MFKLWSKNRIYLQNSSNFNSLLGREKILDFTNEKKIISSLLAKHEYFFHDCNNRNLLSREIVKEIVLNKDMFWKAVDSKCTKKTLEYKNMKIVYDFIYQIE